MYYVYVYNAPLNSSQLRYYSNPSVSFTRDFSEDISNDRIRHRSSEVVIAYTIMLSLLIVGGYGTVLVIPSYCDMAMKYVMFVGINILGMVWLVIDIIIFSVSSHSFHWFFVYPFPFGFGLSLVFLTLVFTIRISQNVHRDCLRKQDLLKLLACLFSPLILTHLIWIFVVMIMYPFETGFAILPIVTYGIASVFTFVGAFFSKYIPSLPKLKEKIDQHIPLEPTTFILILTTAFTLLYYVSFVRYELQKDSHNSLITLLTTTFPAMLLALIGWLKTRISKENPVTKEDLVEIKRLIETIANKSAVTKEAEQTEMGNPSTRISTEPTSTNTNRADCYPMLEMRKPALSAENSQIDLPIES